MRLTYRQLEVFSILIQHSISTTDKEITYSMLRKKIMTNTSINRHNLSKYIKVFEEKKLITCQGRDKSIIVNNDILPIIVDNKISVEFRLFIK